MSIEHLVTMANDIASYFASEPDHDQAVAGVRNHIQKFWAPSMRNKLIAHLRNHKGEGMHALAREAVAQLAEASQAAA